jgi:nucleoside-diphosphate-sugar epimerase
VRDFLDIEDVVDAYAQLLGRDVPAGVYNVASGVGVRIGDALKSLCELAGIEPRVEVNPDYFRPTDIAVGAAHHLHAETNWEPRIPFRQTLEQLLGGWREQISVA